MLLAPVEISPSELAEQQLELSSLCMLTNLTVVNVHPAELRFAIKLFRPG